MLPWLKFPPCSLCPNCPSWPNGEYCPSCSSCPTLPSWCPSCPNCLNPESPSPKLVNCPASPSGIKFCAKLTIGLLSPVPQKRTKMKVTIPHKQQFKRTSNVTECNSCCGFTYSSSSSLNWEAADSLSFPRVAESQKVPKFWTPVEYTSSFDVVAPMARSVSDYTSQLARFV